MTLQDWRVKNGAGDWSDGQIVNKWRKLIEGITDPNMRVAGASWMSVALARQSAELDDGAAAIGIVKYLFPLLRRAMSPFDGKPPEMVLDPDLGDRVLALVFEAVRGLGGAPEDFHNVEIEAQKITSAAHDLASIVAM